MSLLIEYKETFAHCYWFKFSCIAIKTRNTLKFSEKKCWKLIQPSNFYYKSWSSVYHYPKPADSCIAALQGSCYQRLSPRWILSCLITQPSIAAFYSVEELIWVFHGGKRSRGEVVCRHVIPLRSLPFWSNIAEISWHLNNYKAGPKKQIE